MGKLVRDKIPDLMTRDGERFTVHQVQGAALAEALQRKLMEEAEEAGMAETAADLIAELGDVLDVIDALCKAWSISRSEIQEARQIRAQRNGGFGLGLIVERL